MSQLFDGTDDELTYGQALVVLAQHAPFRNQAHALEVETAIRKEHGLELPEPDPVANLLDSRDITLRNQDKEIADLKAQLAARERADAEVLAKAEQIASLKAQVAEGTPADTPADPVAARDADLASRGV